MEKSFPRDVEVLPRITDFVEGFLRAEGLDALSFEVNLIVEELFTNQVKYNPGAAHPIRLALRTVAGGVELRLVDEGVARFDPTEAPEVDIARRPDERWPGGLGIHLVRRLADGIRYHYDEPTGTSTVIVTKRREAPDDRDPED